MSAPGHSQALNLKPTLRPLTPVETAAPTKNPDKFPSGNNESSKATFSRLLAHSRAAAAAAARPPEPPARPTTNPASPPRAARTSSKDADRHADAAPAPAPASDARARPSAAARSGGATAANDAPDATADADAATSTDAAASTAHAPPASADGTVNALAALLAGGLPPAPTVLPPEIQAGTVTANAAADPLRPAATPLTALGKAGAGPAGIDTAASIATGAKGTDARAALAIVGAATGDHGPGQTALPGDPKAALDATAASGDLPNAALAHLAALAAGVGKADEAPKTSTELDTLPLGAGLSIPGQGVAHLVRSIDSPAAATATVSTAVGDPGFHEALAAQVSVFARGGLSKAELHLNPAELGPVSVQITMNGDQARVDFGADRAQTRQAIEAGWAELATSLQDAGFTLSGGGVSEQAGRQASEREAASQNGRTARSAVADDEPVASIVAARPRAGSALDTYA